MMIITGRTYNISTPSPLRNCRNKIISFYAKKARGFMARWIIDNEITTSKELSNFSEEGYYFSPSDSSEEAPVFLRD